MVFEGGTLKLEHVRDAPGLCAILHTRVVGGRSEVFFLGAPQSENDGLLRFDTNWFSRPIWGARHGDLAVLSFDPAVARRILGADLVCPAGGKFVSSEYPVRGSAFFRSDAFPREAGSPAQVSGESATFRDRARRWSAR